MPTVVKTTCMHKSIAGERRQPYEVCGSLQEIAELQLRMNACRDSVRDSKSRLCRIFVLQGVSLFPDDRQLLLDYLRDQRKLESALKRMDELLRAYCRSPQMPDQFR